MTETIPLNHVSRKACEKWSYEPITDKVTLILLKSANAKGCIAQVPILVSRRQTATFDENYQSEREKKKR